MKSIGKTEYIFMNIMDTIYVGDRIHLMVVWIRSSVAVSTAAVASSRTSTFAIIVR